MVALKRDLVKPESSENYLYFQAGENGAVVQLKAPTAFTLSFEISTNGKTWSAWESETQDGYKVFSKQLDTYGDYFFIRAKTTNTWTGSTTNFLQFVTGDKKVGCGGNIMSLLYDNPDGQLSLGNKQYVFYSLFYGCTSLTTAPALPATTLASYCYYSMFQGCTSLTTAPALPATTLASECYRYMFQGCTSLTTAPALSATTLASYCYHQMFRECTNLVVAPELPATALTNSCYSYMFYGCTSLTSGSDMQKARTLNSSCCNQMYYGCKNLTSACTPNVSSWTTSYFTNWLYNVASAGTLYKPSNLTNIEPQSANGVPTGWNTVTFSQTITLTASGSNTYGFSYSVDGVSYTLANGQTRQITLTHPQGITITTTNQTDYVEIDGILKQFGTTVELTYEDLSNGCVISCGHISDANLLSFTAQEAGSTIDMQHNGTNTGTTKPVIYISTDNKNTFTLWDYSTITLSNVGDTVYFYGTNPNGICRSTSNYSQFTMSGKISANGDCTTLITPTGTISVPNYGMYKLFYNCTSLTTAPELPATTLAINCYQEMFRTCTSLTTAPELPATTLANYCYGYMFYGCTSLTTAPELPATTLASCCYFSMFQGCTSLVSAPALPATNLIMANSCYSEMFYGCTSLITAPELPATTLAGNCYQYMFRECTSLTGVPSKLPATTLVGYCYYYMFYGCTSLTTAPELPATTLASNCYYSMFQRCTSLNYIKVGATSWNTSYASNWVSNVSSTGDFYKPEGTTISSGVNGIPNNWTVHNI